MKLGFMAAVNPRRRSRSPLSPPASEGTAYATPAVDKALDVLELLADSSRGMSLTGIADALGRSKHELYRVLVCLQERGYLIRDDGQFYRLSTKLFEIGSQHTATQTLITHATPHMERLSRQLRESCHLSIVDQQRMLVVARAEGDADVMLAVRIGAAFELHRRVSGLVALAHMPEHRRREYWLHSGESVEHIRGHEAHLAEICARGYANEDSPIAIGVTDCATPVLGGGSMLLGVLCVSHLRRKDEAADPAELIEAVIGCAREISGEFSPIASSPSSSGRAGVTTKGQEAAHVE